MVASWLPHNWIISSQFNSMLRKHNWIITQCGKFSDMIYRIKNQYLRWDFWIGTTDCFTHKIQDCDNCLNGSVNGFQIILCSSYISCITSIIRTSHDRAFQKIRENSIQMMTINYDTTSIIKRSYLNPFHQQVYHLLENMLDLVLPLTT